MTTTWNLASALWNGARTTRREQPAILQKLVGPGQLFISPEEDRVCPQCKYFVHTPGCPSLQPEAQDFDLAHALVLLRQGGYLLETTAGLPRGVQLCASHSKRHFYERTHEAARWQLIKEDLDILAKSDISRTWRFKVVDRKK